MKLALLLKPLNQFVYAFLGFVIGVLFFPFLIYTSHDTLDFLINLIPEATGIFFTIVILDQIVHHRADERHKTILLEQLGSKINLVAVSAAEQLWAYHWWWDGTLSKAQLEKADLRGVDFAKANLTGARLAHPRYGEAIFDETTILPDESRWAKDTDMTVFTDKDHPNYWRGYGLRYSNNRKTNFKNANLRGADLRDADFRGADFSHADLSGARLDHSKINGANFSHVLFDERTTLPDGTTWNPECDVCRFGVIIKNGDSHENSVCQIEEK